MTIYNIIKLMVEINIELLLISIIIGVGLIYIYAPKPEIILKMPTESNIYIDTNNVCYKYKKTYI
jgi:hypothetical protein